MVEQTQLDDGTELLKMIMFQKGAQIVLEEFERWPQLKACARDGLTYEQALPKLAADLQAKVLKITSTPHIPTTEVVEAFLEAKKDEKRSLETLKSYKYPLRLFAQEFPILPLSPEPIRKHLGSRKSGSAHYGYTILTGLYKFAEKEYGIEGPMKDVNKPKHVPAEAMPPDEQEAKALLAVIETDRERGLVYLYLGEGFRLSEALGLNIGHILEDKIWLEKGKERREWMPLLPEVRDILLKLADGRDVGEPVFVTKRGRLSDSQVQYDIKKLFERAGITGVKSSPHILRDTFATLTRRAGCDSFIVDRLLRHKDGSMYGLYDKYTLEDLRGALEKYSPIRTLLGEKPDGAQCQPDV